MGTQAAKMISPKIVALTGSIGSGKSTVSKILADLGAEIIDSDILAREVVAPNTPGLARISDLFGPSVLSKDGTELNRKALAKVIFNDPIKRKELEQILHPLIRALQLEKLKQIQSLDPAPKLIVSVIPLLYESGYFYPEHQAQIVVAASPKVALARIMQRDELTFEQAQSRYSSQIPIDQKIKQADYVIENNGSLETLKKQVTELYLKLTAV